MKNKAKEIIDKSDEFIVITPYGASTSCKGKAHLMAMLCSYLKGQKDKNILSDEEIDEIVRISRLDENEVNDELDEKMKDIYKKIEKMDSKEFLDLIKDLI